MESLLNISSSSYLYKTKNKLSKQQVTQLVNEITVNKVGRFIKNIKCEAREINDKLIKYSFFIFKISKEPTFLVNSSLMEQSYGYLLMIEYNNYLVINAKHATGLKKALENIGEPIDYEHLSGFLLTEKTSFKRFSMKNTSISSHNTSIRKRTVEAKNLEDSFSPLSASKQLVNSFLINTEDNSNFTISLTTSKVSERQKKISFTEFCIWSMDIIDKLRDYTPSENYLQGFALPSDKSKLKELEPTMMVVDYSDLVDYIEGCDKVSYTTQDKEISIEKNDIIGLMASDSQQSFELIKDTMSDNKYMVKTTLLNDIYLKKNSKSLKIKSEKLSRIRIHTADGVMDLCEILNDHSQILINFSDIEYAYTNNELFFDHQMEKSTQSFLSIFHTYDELSFTTSEKGDFDETTTEFATNTLFHFIEKTFNKSDYLICDDLGNEIADYIAVKENESIDFYHAKSDKVKKLSAAAFHIVVSQALKNLGSIVNVEKMDLEHKKKIWDEQYGKTRIPKITMNKPSGNIQNAIEMIRKTSLSPSATKRVWLVVDFISKKDLIEQLEKGPNKITIQIIWLLSSFINDCREMGIQPRIACRN